MEKVHYPHSEWNKYLIVTGGCLLAFSIFLPWVQVFIFGDLTFMQMSQLSNNQSFAWLLAALGGACAFVALAYEEKTVLRAWVAVVTAILGLFESLRLITKIDQEGALVRIQFGAYVAVLAGALLLIGVVVRDRQNPVPAKEEFPSD